LRIQFHLSHNKSLKVVPRFARHWTAPVSAFASQIVCAAFRCPLIQTLEKSNIGLFFYLAVVQAAELFFSMKVLQTQVSPTKQSCLWVTSFFLVGLLFSLF
jgi:hypothetical protein